MNTLINNLGFGDRFSLKTILSVDELLNYDMIYIYHHLSVGSVLTLRFKEINLFDDPIYLVSYKGFEIGTVRVSGIMKSFVNEHDEFEAEISAIGKDKYMPIKKLDIQMSVAALKKVG
jgi:hypothetical protein